MNDQGTMGEELQAEGLLGTMVFSMKVLFILVVWKINAIKNLVDTRN